MTFITYFKKSNKYFITVSSSAFPPSRPPVQRSALLQFKVQLSHLPGRPPVQRSALLQFQVQLSHPPGRQCKYLRYYSFKFSFPTLPAASAKVCMRAWVCFILLLWLKTLIYNFLRVWRHFVKRITEIGYRWQITTAQLSEQGWSWTENQEQ